MKIVGFADDAFDMDIIVDELSKKVKEKSKDKQATGMWFKIIYPLLCNLCNLPKYPPPL